MKRETPVQADGIGTRLERKEDLRFLTGQATYVDDVVLPDMRYLVLVRSPYAHARIVAADVAALRELYPDVHVFTAADLPSDCRIPVRIAGGAHLAPFLQPPLAQGKVRYVGEPVAAVVALSYREAEAAAEALAVSYEPLEPVVNCSSAVEAHAKVHDAGNCATEFVLEKGNVSAAFETAPVVVEGQFSIQRHTGMPLEPRGLVASYDAGAKRLRVWGPTKLPYVNRAILARMLALGEQQISFVEPDVGGSFGVRGEFYPEDFIVPFAALRLGRPVKWTETRQEHFVAINHSREQKWKLRVAATPEGKLLAVDAVLVNDTGAYVRTHGTIVAHHAGTSLPGPYFLEHYRCRVSCAITNKTPTGTMRAPGMFEATFVRERAMDLLAERLRLNPLQVRKRNFIRPEQMPYLIYPNWHGPYKPLYDNGDFAGTFEKTLAHLDQEGELDFEPRKAGSLSVACGIACAVEPSGLGPFERARIRVDIDGRFYVYVGTTSQGQGQETTFAQICAEVLGVPSDQVTIRHGNTDDLQSGYGTNASRGAVIGGKAVYQACQSLLQRARTAAAMKLRVEMEQVRYERGAFSTAGNPGSTIAWKELAAACSPLAVFHGTSPVTGFESGDGLEAYAHAGNIAEGTSVFSVHWARVSVDTETGEVKVLDYLVSADIGRALNPTIVEGQLHGGVAMGLGGALSEELVYDGSSMTTSDSSTPRVSWTTPCRSPSTYPTSARSCSKIALPRPIRSA
jgi:aerobic carbon-monoxide dehydrogenase large subunit